jgi:hypothetical protein
MEDRSKHKRLKIGWAFLIMGVVCGASLLAWELISPKENRFEHLETLVASIFYLLAIAFYLTVAYLKNKSGPWSFLRKDGEGERDKTEIE